MIWRRALAAEPALLTVLIFARDAHLGRHHEAEWKPRVHVGTRLDYHLPRGRGHDEKENHGSATASRRWWMVSLTS